MSMVNFMNVQIKRARIMTHSSVKSPKEPVIHQNKDLTAFNTLGLPSKAARFVEAESVEGLFALKKQGFFEDELPFILGGGSNVLLNDHLKKPVLKNSIPGIKVIRKEGDHLWVEAGAGENWHKLVRWAVEREYGGIENLALIPGTVGAAPIQNIGAYGVELEQVFEQLECFDMRDGTRKEFNRDDCLFGYRDSIFKRKLKGKVIVTKVVLRLTRNNHTIHSSYRSLKEYLQKLNITEPAIQDIFDAVVAIRRSKLPDPADLGNAGSFFKNPVVERSVLERIRGQEPGVPFYDMEDDLVKIPAGWLIEMAGWKGKRVGNVGTYENQALVIVNHGGATGEEVYSHAMAIKRSVMEIFGIELVPEVNIVE
jgi:UDP-N-acetylmuramate dehydrogenase